METDVLIDICRNIEMQFAINTDYYMNINIKQSGRVLVVNWLASLSTNTLSISPAKII